MSLSFRQLLTDDFNLYKTMETGLKEDYMLKVFDRLISNENTLYGLFDDDNLVAVAGYTLFAGEYAMLGRLRSDSRHRKNGYGTKITEYILKEAKQTPSVKWIGANTELHNKAAQKVLEKINMPHIVTLYAAQTDDLTLLLSGEEQELWEKVESNDEKKHWIEKTYLNPAFEKAVFPFEAYYPFPASPALFTNEKLDGMTCFRNKDHSRVVFMWPEEKGDKFIHVVYPWSDFIDQPGFFETVSKESQRYKESDLASLIWMDLTEEEVETLPSDHPFKLPSPWMLHGFFKSEREPIEASIDTARELIEQIEDELNELNAIVDHNQDKLNTLDRLNEDLDSSL